MSDRITSRNIDEVIRKNREIKDEIDSDCAIIKAQYNQRNVSSIALLSIHLLRKYGLIMMPVDNPYFGGAIYVKDEKKIPFVNTAQPRANQYFTAWHEVYHLMFDRISFDHVISVEATLEERKAEYFAACMLLGNLFTYYSNLPTEMDFISKICYCMDVFQAPYKAVMISLYEAAINSGNKELQQMVLTHFDAPVEHLAEKFEQIGLDKSLVCPSYVVNLSMVESKVREAVHQNDELTYHKDNLQFLEKVKKEIILVTGDENGEHTGI